MNRTVLFLIVCLWTVPLAAQEFKKTNYLRSNDSGAHCGVYAILGAVKVLGVEPKIKEVLSSEYVSDSLGSTVDDLVRATRLHGLHATPIKGATVSWLKSSNDPILLRLVDAFEGEARAHWVLFLGDKNGMARLYDPPREPEYIEFAHLLAFWDGHAIVVSNDIPTSYFTQSSVASALEMSIWFVVTILGVASIRCWLPKTTGKEPASSQIIAIMVFALILACAFHWFISIGFFANYKISKSS